MQVIIESTKKGIKESVFSSLEKLKPDISGRVLIKPNLVGGGPPGICTNADVLKALVEWLSEKGIKPILADGSGIEPTSQAYRKAGWERIPAKFIDLNRDRYQKVYPEKPLIWDEIQIAKTYLTADFVIDVPVLKCHHLAGVSLSIKNLIGILKPIPDPNGQKRVIHHEWSYRELDPKPAREIFEKRLIDLFSIRPPDLVLVDGTWGLEEYETSQKRVKTDLIVLSEDAITADWISCQIMGFRPEEIGHLKLAVKIFGKPKPQISGKIPKFRFSKSRIWLDSLR